MQEKETKLYWGKEGDMKLLADKLSKDEVVISSTDTVYGFLGKASLESYNKICELKNSVRRRPFLLLVGEINKIFSFIDKQSVSNRKLEFLARCWPGPLTVLFRAKEGVPSFLVSERGTIALRCPDHKGLLSVLKNFDGLFSTSANRSDDPAPTRFSEISPELLIEVGCIVMGAAESFVTQPSTIIDFSSTIKEDFTVIREGAYSVEELKKIYESVG
jgi:L-threonylcarbamoyladenylate synthase